MAKENSIERAAKEQIQLPTERKQFKNLVLSNPNYFGTFPKLGGKVVKALNGNTTYEQLACLGLNQGSDLLEGVINIKQHSGYGTDGCGAGTTEYVRFLSRTAAAGTIWVLVPSRFTISVAPCH